MPKTNVYPPARPETPAAFRVEVGWRPDGDVQIATTQRVDTGPDNEPIWQGLAYVDLDRTGINTLIRVLREARDKAFGRDQ